MKRKLIFRLIFLLLLTNVVCLAIIRYRTRGVELKVINDGIAPIKLVKIEFTGGTRVVPQISSKTEYKTRLNPTGESDLKIEFVDSNGINHRQSLDVYFERNYRGRIIIKIESSGKVSWVDDIKLGLI
jgi:hypothetical protein